MNWWFCFLVDLRLNDRLSIFMYWFGDVQFQIVFFKNLFVSCKCYWWFDLLNTVSPVMTIVLLQVLVMVESKVFSFLLPISSVFPSRPNLAAIKLQSSNITIISFTLNARTLCNFNSLAQVFMYLYFIECCI